MIKSYLSITRTKSKKTEKDNFNICNIVNICKYENNQIEWKVKIYIRNAITVR